MSRSDQSFQHKHLRLQPKWRGRLPSSLVEFTSEQTRHYFDLPSNPRSRPSHLRPQQQLRTGIHGELREMGSPSVGGVWPGATSGSFHHHAASVVAYSTPDFQESTGSHELIAVPSPPPPPPAIQRKPFIILDSLLTGGQQQFSPPSIYLPGL
jgi:hypothetical protein